MGLLAIGLILTLIGILSFYRFVRIMVRESEIRGWPTAQAKMLSCTPKITIREGLSFGPVTQNSTAGWTVEASYVFDVSGHDFHGSRISNVAPFAIRRRDTLDSPPPDIQRICVLYRPGTTVQIHYGPNNPSLNYAYFSPNHGKIALLIIGSVFVFCGFLATWIALQ